MNGVDFLSLGLLPLLAVVSVKSRGLRPLVSPIAGFMEEYKALEV